MGTCHGYPGRQPLSGRDRRGRRLCRGTAARRLATRCRASTDIGAAILQSRAARLFAHRRGVCRRRRLAPSGFLDLPSRCLLVPRLLPCRLESHRLLSCCLLPCCLVSRRLESRCLLPCCLLPCRLLLEPPRVEPPLSLLLPAAPPRVAPPPAVPPPAVPHPVESPLSLLLPAVPLPVAPLPIAMLPAAPPPPAQLPVSMPPAARLPAAQLPIARHPVVQALAEHHADDPPLAAPFAAAQSPRHASIAPLRQWPFAVPAALPADALPAPRARAWPVR